MCFLQEILEMVGTRYQTKEQLMADTQKDFFFLIELNFD